MVPSRPEFIPPESVAIFEVGKLGSAEPRRFALETDEQTPQLGTVLHESTQAIEDARLVET